MGLGSSPTVNKVRWNTLLEGPDLEAEIVGQMVALAEIALGGNSAGLSENMARTKVAISMASQQRRNR